ncbi:MAG: hypothetical protein ACTSP4_06495 [Candidatus Hodarchaeales archaeon]
MIGIDTFSCYKILRLQKEGWFDILSEILENEDFFITYDVRKELEYRFPSEMACFEKFIVLPRLNKKYDEYLARGFDPADASLLEYMEVKGLTLVTEDHPMLNEGITLKKNVIQLADFFGLIAIQGFISYNELYHLVKYLRKLKNITKRKEKELLNLSKPL